MKQILGLDLGTNSIGWALIEQDFDKKEGNIIDLGSRIIPMSQELMGKFDSGKTVSQTAERTHYRGVRRLYERRNLRRDRLHRVLNILGFLPEHYKKGIDFSTRFGQFKEDKEPKLNYKEIENGRFEFIFKKSFDEMVSDFQEQGIEKIPYDWTIYYLRKKALTQPITKEELAWILLNFNQKRGYYQLRGDEIDETSTKKFEEYYALKVINVEATADKNARGIWYNVHLENGLIYRRQSKESLSDWIGTIKEFIVTTTLDNEGNPKRDKQGEIKKSFKAVNSEADWIAIKKKTEQDLEQAHKTVGCYIYDTLLKVPNQKIRGKLIRTIEREFYKNELRQILEEQKKHHRELQNTDIYQACITELYPRNEAHRSKIANEDFIYLFLDDLIFYQRPLKSKKSSIANCPFESRFYRNKEGKIEEQELKCIPKSHPLFQEFRLWQFIQNLSIYEREVNIKGKPTLNHPITDTIVKNQEDYVKLFDYLAHRKEVDQKVLLKYFGLNLKKFRWNYPEDKTYPTFETRSQIVSRLSYLENVDREEILSKRMELNLWHIIYSVKEPQEYKKALKTFAQKNNLNEDVFVEAFKSFPPFANDYGAYSQKALKKLLPLMRMGKYWVENKIDEKTKDRIQQIITRIDDAKSNNIPLENVSDDDVPLRLLRSFSNTINPYSGLNTYQASYAVYNRFSEIKELTPWRSPKDIENFLKDFKQHSLRNPIVEQVVLETLRMVKTIWEEYGNGDFDFFDEIHVELGREMKMDKASRKKLSSLNIERETTNERMRHLLREIYDAGNKDAKSYSPSQQEILKIYEEGVYDNSPEKYQNISLEDIDSIRRKNSPSKNEIQKYRLWLEQGYVSPYTGKIIPLSKLFTTEYEIEHIIPQSRYFDNSLSNKIICESAINPHPYKGNQTAFEFIKNQGGSLVPELSFNGSTSLLTLEEYQAHCEQYFSKSRSKLKKLLSEEIPDSFTERQLNDSRYISKLIKSLLSNIVREENEQESTAKKLVPVVGAITAKLRQDWGLNDKWNDLIAPRFKRLNKITNTNDFGFQDGNIYRLTVPEDLKSGFSSKRIDHRHHALDALVVACITKDHTNYITSLNTKRKNYSLVEKLRHTKEMVRKDGTKYKVAKSYKKPWKGFASEAQEKLENIVVSFKQNKRVLTKTNNKYQKWVEDGEGIFKKKMVPQTKGDMRTVRKPMHKETVYSKSKLKRIKGEVALNRALMDWEMIADKKVKSIVRPKALFYNDNIKDLKKHFKAFPIKINEEVVSKVLMYEYIEADAVRRYVTSISSRKQLVSITDLSIQRILERHLANYKDEKGNESFDLAFSPEGVFAMNKNIQTLNNGKPHQPIYKVRLSEVGNKFKLGETGNKKDKYVEAAKGTNLFFAVYWDEEKQKRNYETIPLNEVVEHQKQRLHLPKEVRTEIPIKPELGQFLFSLSPDDLVYVPTDEEIHESGSYGKNLSSSQLNKIYKMVSSSGNQCFFIKHEISKTIWNKREFSALNKIERDIEGNMVKERCWKLTVNRLGKIEQIIK
ncbi:CRISPR-associated protein Csn1 [Aequorivita sp. F47161]|uniref:CRISPR-associated endonuclease Cas9 n=1 Tax=Aequorivita vitellina TaxID=2874475 RepID=A0A9X1U3G0_9FLAO|nr:type II CRISPR RNA-guided endonuclease Cas9 [Aequorivita vitellina]MCG2419523.1 CRISPR-associated protein Csn1 [Aequorivita vitellina]